MTNLTSSPDDAKLLESLFDRLWPLTRSITGDGVRASHDILSEIIPLLRLEVPSGKEVFDWTVPPEWQVNDAYIIGPNGERVIDVADHNLHLVSYSEPFKGVLTREELDSHLHSIPELPDVIPYVTSYYHRAWGFCLTENQRRSLPDGDYTVVVDTAFKEDGSMTLSEAVLPGEIDDEILISTYTCHPSMANNELSGPLATALLYQRIARMERRKYTYRFAFLAETIGAVTYLADRGEHLRKHLKAGMVVTCVGLDEPINLKQTPMMDTLIDRAGANALASQNILHEVIDYYPWGSDERQYSSPAFELPVAMMLRGHFIDHPAYHTSDDNKELISFDAMVKTVDALQAICQTIELNATYRGTVKGGEPQLGKYGIYPNTGARRQVEHERRALMWVLALSNGHRDMIEISNRSGISVADLNIAAQNCLERGLLVDIDTE
jgi:aminopeptidase-like protein